MTYPQNESESCPVLDEPFLSGQKTQNSQEAQAGLDPLVSVVIPCYNSARYLAETLDSVQAQTYSRVEIIIVDDGSTDETANIARSYPVTYLYQKNRGISAARNAGIVHSKGKYIQLLDHDDRLLPEAVATGVRLLEANPDCSIAVGEHFYIGTEGAKLGQSHKCAAGRDHYSMLLEHNFIETPCSALHRRSGFTVSGLFDETVLGAEDYELYLRTARSSSFIGHDTPVSEYRLHDSNTSRNAEMMMLVSHRVLQMELPYLLNDPAKMRLYRRGRKFIDRHFGRQITRQLIFARQLKTGENRRKLMLLWHHYTVGLVVVAVSRILPSRVVNAVFV